jgi:putative ABC transport system permease protein
VAGPVAWGTIGVAVTMLLTAARSWLSRRSQQVTVLTLRGAGPVALGLKAVGELLPAIVAGVTAGVGAGVAVVRIVGPDPGIEGGALVEGLVVVAVALALALLAVVLVVAAGARRVGVGTGGAAPRRALLPWEPVVLAVAAAALFEVQTRPPISDGARVDGLLLVFPLLLFAGGAGAVARVVLSRRVLAAVAARAPGAVWLAARRLAASRARASLIVTGAAISIGIVVFAGATSSSVRATAYAKATLGDGAAQIVRLAAHADQPPAAAPIPGVSTLVTRTVEPSVLRQGHDRAEVLGVDPATFADAALWDTSFAGRSLGSLLDDVTVPAGETPGALPAIAVGDGLPDRLVLTLPGEDGDVAQEVEVVARARAFPGFESAQERPLVVIDRSALTRIGVVEHPEVWIDDADPSLPDRLADDGYTIIYSRRAAADVAGTLLQPQVWAIDYLEVIGLAAGLVTVAGLGLHFAADAERRRLGAALARRLGLPAGQVIGATLVEVAVILLAGLVLGVGLAWIAVRLVFRRLDPLPRTPPEALLRYDLALVGVCALVAVVVAVVVTLVVERRSARSSLPGLLRAAR